MRKGFLALVLEIILFWCCYSLWKPMFEQQREQERREIILNSVTADMCQQGLNSYLRSCKDLNEPVINGLKLVSKSLGESSVYCKIEGNIVFSYRGKKCNGTYKAEGYSDSITSLNIVHNISIERMRIYNSKHKIFLQFNHFGEIIVEKLKIGESVTIDGIKCLFERTWDSGEWYMKTSKILTPTQMYKIFNNPKCYNPNGIRFSTDEFLLYGFVTSGQIFVSKRNGVVHRYAARIDNNDKVTLKRID